MERIEKTEVKVMFKSKDGRMFSSEQSCLEHENRYDRWWGNDARHKVVIDDEGYYRDAFYVDNDGEELQQLLWRTSDYYRGAPSSNGWFYLNSNHDGELLPISDLKEALQEALETAKNGLELLEKLGM